MNLQRGHDNVEFTLYLNRELEYTALGCSKDVAETVLLEGVNKILIGYKGAVSPEYVGEIDIHDIPDITEAKLTPKAWHADTIFWVADMVANHSLLYTVLDIEILANNAMAVHLITDEELYNGSSTT